MTAFKKTILGKVLGVAGKAFAVIGGVTVGGAALKAVTGGLGALQNGFPTDNPKQSGLSIVAEKAKMLFSGLNKEQQEILEKEKAAAKTAAQKLKLANKLMNMGLSQSEAYSKAGISAAEAANVNNVDEEKAQKAGLGGNSKLLTYLAIGAAALFILPKLFKK